MNVLERLWAYVTLGAMGSLWSEASPLIGGLAAHDGNLVLGLVILSVTVGTWAGLQLFYFLGRWRGRWLRKSFPKFRPVILRSVAVVRRHPWRASLAVRFAYGLRIALPVACGVARVPLVTYAVGSAASSLVWTVGFTLLGWALGRTTERILGHVRDLEGAIGVVVVILMIVGYVVVRRRHLADRTAEVIDRDR